MENKISLKKDSEADIAYLLGAIHDGCLVKRRTTKRYDIQFFQKNKKWLEESILRRLKNFGIETKIQGPRKNVYFLKFGNKELYKLLENKKLETENPEFMRIFVRGFWDAEGSCPHVEKYLSGERKRKKIPPQIGFHQNGFENLNLLKQLKEFLEKNSIECGKITGPFFREQSNKPEFRFFFYGRKRAKRFLDFIQPEHPDKRMRLNLLVEN